MAARLFGAPDADRRAGHPPALVPYRTASVRAISRTLSVKRLSAAPCVNGTASVACASTFELGITSMTHNAKCVEPGFGSVRARIWPTHLRGSLAERIRYIWRAYWEWRARRAV